ncbi:hypothetical protein G7085_10125 [Tessaracoccus sp. HDW20]|uniref:hypothetical protein n=1 Tax=Tessaracoccus coleopterorum TaxID=2714950 RepID=UPI0018D287CF|nr:hypothetical protein [Tessaracoccus coleopterorum]NHB84834.1 hypothetical protein [Tessaracoccus coleopterorum]
MDNALYPRLGGPMGRHPVRRGFWFSPLATVAAVSALLFTALYLRHVPCLQTEATNPINSYIRVCYSDIQTTFLSQGLGAGTSPLSSEQLVFPPLIAVIVLLTRNLASLLSGVSGADLQAQIDQSVPFFSLTAVGLYLCFLVACLALARSGRGTENGRPSWDSVLLAASPVVLASGLISWDLVPIAITLIGLAAFARGRTVEAGWSSGSRPAPGRCRSVSRSRSWSPAGCARAGRRRSGSRSRPSPRSC